MRGHRLLRPPPLACLAVVVLCLLPVQAAAAVGEHQATTRADSEPPPADALAPASEPSLQICPATAAEGPHELDWWAELFRALKFDRSPRDAGGWAIGRVIVVPDMGPPAWAVTVYLPDRGEAILELVELPERLPEAMLLQEPQERRSSTSPGLHRRQIPRDLAEHVADVLIRAVEVADLYDETIRIHPTWYYFLAWKEWSGFVCARAAGPPSDSLGDELLELTDLLASFARGRTKEVAVRSQLKALRQLLGSPVASYTVPLPSHAPGHTDPLGHRLPPMLETSTGPLAA